MRKSFIIAAVLVAALTSCQKELQEISETGADVVRATREALTDDTKASISDDGAFAWTAKDAIAIYDGTSSWNTYTTAKGGSSSATFSGLTHNKADYAVYPAALKPAVTDGAVSVTLPSEYDWVADQTNVPMLATFENAEDGINFKHLGGLVKFTFKNVPAADGSLIFWATDSDGNYKKISGSFTVEDGQISTSAAEAEDKVTVSFEKADVPEEGTMAFYIPVPVGEYVFNVEFISGEDVDLVIEGSSVKTIARKTFKRISAFELDIVDAGGESKAAATVTVDKTLDANEVVYLPATGADVNVYFTAAQTNAITLTYNNLQESDKPGSVYVYAANGDEGLTISDLTIKLGDSHVELLSGTYTTLNATTSETTLVVGAGASVGTLTATAGGVTVEGSVTTSLTSASSSAVTVAKGASVTDLTISGGETLTIAGTVSDIKGSSAPANIRVKTTGTVSATSNSSAKGASIVYVEKQSDEVKGSFPGTAGDAYTIINTTGLQSGVDATAADGTLTLSSNYECADTVYVSKNLTINFGSYSVGGVIKVASGAKLTLKGSAGTLYDNGNDIIVNGGELVLESGVSYNGVVVNNAGSELTVSDNVLLAKVTNLDADKKETHEAYVNDAATFKTAAADTAITRITLTKAIAGVTGDAVDLKGSKTDSKVTPRVLTIDLRGKGYGTSSADAFNVENANVEIINSSYDSATEANAATIDVGSANVVLNLVGASATQTDDYTVVTLGEGVKFEENIAINVDSQNNYGISVTSNGADMSKAGIEVSSTGTAKSTENYPEFTIKGGSVKYISGASYAKWTLTDVTVGEGEATDDAITLSAGEMTINGTYDETWSTSIKAGSSNNAINVSGGKLTVNGGEISAKNGIAISGGELTVESGTITGSTSALDISSTPEIAINGGDFVGAITGSASESVKKDNTAVFNDVTAASHGAEDATVNIKLTSASTLSTALTVPDKKTVVLDLNGQAYTGTATVNLGGTLTVNDSSENGNGSVTALFTNKGTATLNGGKYSKIVNEGKLMTINSGVKVANTTAVALIQNGYDNYSSGYESGTNAAAPELIINGGEFTGSESATSVVLNAQGGELEIYGGTFENTNADGKVIYNKHIATISKTEDGAGVFYAANYNEAVVLCSESAETSGSVVNPYQKGETTIAGGFFKGLLSIDGSDNYASISITDGEFSVDPAAYVAEGYAATGTYNKVYGYTTWTVSESSSEASPTEPVE